MKSLARPASTSPFGLRGTSTRARQPFFGEISTCNENNIGGNIKKQRAKQGLSQEDFAKKSGVKYTTITKIESNVIKTPSVLLMAKIAKTLGVAIEDLIK